MDTFFEKIDIEVCLSTDIEHFLSSPVTPISIQPAYTSYQNFQYKMLCYPRKANFVDDTFCERQHEKLLEPVIELSVHISFMTILPS